MSKMMIILTASAMLLSGCAKESGPYSKSGVFFDTIVSIDLYGVTGDPDAILSECMRLCSHYESLFDKDIPSSDTAAVNSGNAKTVSVDPDTAYLVSRSLEYSDLSNGRFDITIEPVSALWDFHEGKERIPSQSEIDAALLHVDHNLIHADTVNNTVTADSDGMSIDVGAAAKGYIADKIAQYLLTCPVSGAIINMGGDIKLIGTKPGGDLFNIGINDPGGSGGCVASLLLSDKAVATSGIYERAFTADGRTYHHILDPADGYPADTDVLSVTVITETALDADCLCTTAILLGSKEALKLIEKTGDTEAVIITTDGAMKKTSGADAYIRQ